MKKTILTVSVVLAMTMAACGGKSDGNTAADGTVSVEEVAVETVDTVGGQEVVTVEEAGTVQAEPEADGASLLEKIKSATPEQMKELAGKVQAYVSQLVSSGKIKEAKAYMEQAGPYLKSKAPKVYEAVTKAIDSADKLDALKDKTEDLKEKVSEKSEAAKETAKEKAAAAADKAKDMIKGL